MARILCIDDEVISLATRMLVLQGEGHEVVQANSGKEGVEIIQSGQPIDIVVVDHFMPGMTGIETARQIALINPTIPIIMLSGFIELPDESLGIVDRWVTKRNPRDLLDAIQTISDS